MRFFLGETKFDFIRMSRMAIIISVIMTVGSLVLLTTKGLQYGVDFTGGHLVEIQTTPAPDLSDLRESLNNLGLGDISIQEFGSAKDLSIRMPQQKGGIEEQKAAIEKLRTHLDEKFETVDYRRVEFVGPQVGEELKLQGLYAILLSVLGILIYVSVRFEWQYGVAALASLIHDTLATVGLFALTGMEFNLSTLAAVLLVAGYSINDTVVVFDRIRENLRKFKKTPFTEIINNSINQTLSRTTMTSFTTLLALSALWLFGGEVIRGFSNALLFGILVGTFSSIFVAAPVLTFLNMKRNNKSQENEEIDTLNP